MTEKKQAVHGGTAQVQNEISATQYHSQGNKSSSTPDEKIAKWRSQIPKAYQRNFDLAMSGRSPKAGIKAKCLDCMGYMKNEIKFCLDVTCPLLPYRPYQNTTSKQPSKGPSLPLEPEIAS